MITHSLLSSGVGKILASEPKPASDIIGTGIGNAFNKVKGVISSLFKRIKLPTIDLSTVQLPEAKTDIGQFFGKFGIWIAVAIIITLIVIFGKR